MGYGVWSIPWGIGQLLGKGLGIPTTAAATAISPLVAYPLSAKSIFSLPCWLSRLLSIKAIKALYLGFSI